MGHINPCTDDVNLLDVNMNTVKKNTQTLGMLGEK
jgi:hypothetical protein